MKKAEIRRIPNYMDTRGPDTLYSVNLYKDNEWLTWRRRKFEKDIVIDRMIDYLIKISRPKSGSKSFCKRLEAHLIGVCSRLTQRDEVRHSYTEMPDAPL